MAVAVAVAAAAAAAAAVQRVVWCWGALSLLDWVLRGWR